MSMRSDPPVRATGSVEIATPPAAVWRLMSRIEDWPAWNPDVRDAHLDGELEPGTAFTWRAGPGRIRSRLTAVETGSLLAWEGKMLGIRAVHEWTIRREGHGSVVTTTEAWSGVLPRLLAGPMRRVLQEAIDSGLRHMQRALIDEPAPDAR